MLGNSQQVSILIENCILTLSGNKPSKDLMNKHRREDPKIQKAMCQGKKGSVFHDILL